MKQLILGICGPARSGKNEIARFLEKYHEFHEDSFAAPIRKALMHILKINKLSELDELKDIPHPLLKGKTPRYAMQTLGTEWGRYTISDTLWIDSCMARCENYHRAVISDVRFDNEAKAIKDAGGFIIYVNRPDIRIAESSHVSEAGINEEYYDYIINNIGSIDYLYQSAETMIESIYKKVYR